MSLFLTFLTLRSDEQVTSLYLYNIQETNNENTQTYQLEVVVLIYHRILVACLQGNVWQLEGRVNNQILRAKGLNGPPPPLSFLLTHAHPQPSTTVKLTDGSYDFHQGNNEGH